MRIPFFESDQGQTERFLNNFRFVIRGQLDAQRLADAAQWIAINKWPKIAATINRDANKRLFYQIPDSFSTNTPLSIIINNNHISQPLKDSPLYIPTPTPGKISIQKPFLANDDFFSSPSTVWSLQDYIKHQIAVLQIHITPLADATAIGLTTPHCFNDILGLRMFIDAWMAVLSGNGDSIPALAFDKDPLALDILPAPYQDPPTGWYLFSWVQFALLAFSMVWEMIRHPKEEGRSIYIPASEIQKMREASAGSEKDSWVSESDITTAWLMKALHQDLPTRSHSKTSLVLVVDLRKRLPSFLSEPTFQALFHMSTAPISRTFIQHSNVKRIAQEIRSAISTQLTNEGHVAKAFSWYLHTKLKREPMFFPPLCNFVVLTNWLSANLSQLDFSSALTVPGSTTAKPIFVGVVPRVTPKIPFRNGGCISFKDDEGGIWITFMARKEIWDGPSMKALSV